MKTLLLLGLLLAPLTLALYEDQASTFDWWKPFVGPVNSAAFHKHKPRLYVGTQEGVVGALNLRDGSIAWRRKLAGPAQTLLLDSPAVLVSLAGGLLQAWDHTEGTLKWEADLGQAAAQQASMVLVPGEPAKVAVLGGGQIQVRCADSCCWCARWVPCSASKLRVCTCACTVRARKANVLMQQPLCLVHPCRPSTPGRARVCQQ